jgi:hypothetical protein
MFEALFLHLPSFGLFWSLFHILAFSETWLNSQRTNQLVAFDVFNVFRCDRSRAAVGGVALFVNRSIKTTAAGSYFEYVLVSFRFNDVSILLGSTFNPDRLHFDEVKAFLDLLALVSLDFDHLIVLGDFNFDILLDLEHSATRGIVTFLTLYLFRFSGTTRRHKACFWHVHRPRFD